MFLLNERFHGEELTSNISIVFCLPLSAKLLMYIRVALLRASASAPAIDIFPCRVNEDFRAPVPAYILDSAYEALANVLPSYCGYLTSPLSAQILECLIQKSVAARSLRWLRNASIAIWLIIVCIRLVRSRQSRQFVRKTPSC